MSYNKGTGQFGRGNIWAMLRQLLDGQGSINPSDQAGSGALQTAKATFDVAVDGGAIGTILPVNSPIIPAGALVQSAIIYPITLPVGPGASIAIGVGAQTAVIKGATVIATYVAGAQLVGLPIWASGFFKVTTDAKISFTVSGAVLTAGKIAVEIQYTMAGE
jgi:hypothetical protein